MSLFENLVRFVVITILCAVAFGLGIAFILSMNGCASREVRREQLQAEHPECFVTYDLEIICEDTPW